METEIEIKYPSPNPDNWAFTHYWNMILPDIQDRENLKPSHLQQLRILCSLYCEYDELMYTIEHEGRTYESIGRNGRQIKLRPEIALLKSTILEIRNYSKMLDLVLVKDKKMTNLPEEEENEFES